MVPQYFWYFYFVNPKKEGGFPYLVSRDFLEEGEFIGSFFIWNETSGIADNMLKNLHALPLDRIYSMLKMFYMQSPEIENLSMHELRQFLDRKVFERKLIFTNGLYNLNPETPE